MVDQGMKIGLVFPRAMPLSYRFSGNSNPVTFVDAMPVDVAKEMEQVQLACVALLALERPSRAADLLRLTGVTPPRPRTQDVSAPWLVARFLWHDTREVYLDKVVYEHSITNEKRRKV